jgi:two-component system response regulator NreC
MQLLLIDCHELVRECLSNALQAMPHVGSILQASDRLTALGLARTSGADLALIDMDLPCGALECAAELLSAAPQCRIVFMDSGECDAHIERAIELGARGYILKTDSFRALAEGLIVIQQGGWYFSPAIRSRLNEIEGRPVFVRPASDRLAVLSPTERRLLAELARGASLKEAAARLQMRYKTADCHKSNLMHKLGIHDRVQLARFAIREGLVGLTDDWETLQMTG